MSRTAVRLVTDSAELAEVMRIRHEVFVAEQAVPVELERDEWDEGAEHFLATLDGRPAGTVRLVVEHPGRPTSAGWRCSRRPAAAVWEPPWSARSRSGAAIGPWSASC